MQINNNFYKRLAIARSQFNPIKKDIQAFKYKYAALDQICDVVDSVLLANDLELLQTVTLQDSKRILRTFIVDLIEGKEYLRCERILDEYVSGIKHAIQDMGAVETYSRRYDIVLALRLASEDDLDSKPKFQPVSPKKINNEESIKQNKIVTDIAYCSDEEQNNIKELFHIKGEACLEKEPRLHEYLVNVFESNEKIQIEAYNKALAKLKAL